MKRTMYCIVLLTCVQLGYAQDFIGKAKISLGTRDTTLAIKNFEEALKAGQKTAECNYYLGAIAFARNKTDDAISYLQASLKGNDENVEALKVLGDAYMRKKNTEEALTQYRKAERLAKKNPAVLTAYGEALLAADSTDAAIRMLVLAKEYDATDPAIFRGLGDAYLKQNVLPLAISQYQKAVELDPKDISTRFALARLFAKGRQYNDAVREYDGVITIDSTYADAYFAKGNILLLAKQYKNAIPPLRKCVMLRPKSAEGATLLAKALFGAHDYPEAAQAAERALALDSTNVDIWRISAYSLVEMKDFRTALGAFGALQRRKAFKPEDQTKYGAALFGLGKEDEALNSLLAAVQLDSANCDPYSSLGSIYMNKRDYEKAAAMFEKKIACEPGKLSAYLNGAACYMQLKAFPRVRQLLTHVLDVEPELMLGRFMLARYFTQVDSLSMAKEQYDEVLKVAATNPEKYKKEMGEAHGQTGQYYFIMRQYERAIESFKRTVPLGYDNPSLHLMWGQSLLQLLDPKGDQAENKKKIDEAVRQFRRTIELEPNSEQGHLWLAQGLVFSRVEGDNAGNQRLKDEACGEYRKVLKVNPRNEDAKKGIERIGCPGVGK